LKKPQTLESKLSEELPLTDHVMGGAGVKAPPVSLVIVGVVTKEGMCFRLGKVESRYVQCC